MGLSSTLPDLMYLSDYGGSWTTYVDAVHAEFRRLYVTTPPRCGVRPFSVRKKPLSQGREAGFWHLVSEGEVENDRLPAISRMERIRYPRHLIDAAPTGAIPCWRQDRGRSGLRILLATPDFDYLTVLGANPEYVSLITGYPIEQERRQGKLRREWEENQLATPW
jgi:hypothetical protein